MICQITIFFIYIFFYLQSQAYEFQFGLEYAWTMCIYAVSMTYSITCPIIMPFGECVFVRASSSLCVCVRSVWSGSLSPATVTLVTSAASLVQTV